MGTSSTIIATIFLDPKGRMQIVAGQQDLVHQLHLHLTEDHIDELLQINQAYYKEWLKKALTNFPIL